MNWKKRFYTISIGLGILLLGSFLGYMLATMHHASQLETQINLLRSPDSTYAFIDPLVGVDFAPNQDFPELNGTQDSIQTYIKNATASKKVSRVSVYLRNLSNAHWIDINKDEKFDPGSLLKVPIMMAYFKLAESNPTILDQRIWYSSSAQRPLVLHEMPSILKSDQAYTVNELIHVMIAESDNAAKDLLLANLNTKYILAVYDDLGIPLRGHESDPISTEVCASFFRRLYNATFLNREYSEKALALLNKATFTDGIVKGLNAKIPIAHKYGERESYDRQGNLVGVELHDCGILYFPNTPELLCVMTEGRSISELKTVIQNIANIVSTHTE